MNRQRLCSSKYLTSLPTKKAHTWPCWIQLHIEGVSITMRQYLGPTVWRDPANCHYLLTFIQILSFGALCGCELIYLSMPQFPDVPVIVM